MDKFHYTAQNDTVWAFFIHFAFGCKDDKNVVENLGHPLLEEQKHFILGSQNSTCLKLPPF